MVKFNCNTYQCSQNFPFVPLDLPCHVHRVWVSYQWYRQLDPALHFNGGGPLPVFLDSRRCWEAFFFVSLVYEDHFFLTSSTVRVWAEELQELILSQILSQALFLAALVTTFDSLLNIMSLFCATSSKRTCISALKKFGLIFLLMIETIMQFTKRFVPVWSVWAPRGKIIH